MKNKLIIICIVCSVFSCKKQDFSIQSEESPSETQAFVLKNCFIQNLVEQDSFGTEIINNAPVQVYVLTKFFFDLKFDFYNIDREEFRAVTKLPTLVDFYTVNNSFSNFSNAVFQDSTPPTLSITASNTQSAPTDYEHLIITNPTQDANAMYFAATGFLLNDYLETQAIIGNTVNLGFYNNSSELVTIVEKDPMTVFFEQSANPERNANPTFVITNPQHLLNQIEQGINQLATNPNIKKHLTIITYALYNEVLSGEDSLKLNNIEANLLAENISLNIISLLPVPYLQSLSYVSNGFFQNDIPFINDLAEFTFQASEFTALVESRILPSSASIKNMHKMIGGQSNTINSASIKSVYFDNDNTDILLVKELLEAQTFHVRWRDTESHIPLQFELRPTVF